MKQSNHAWEEGKEDRFLTGTESWGGGGGGGRRGRAEGRRVPEEDHGCLEEVLKVIVSVDRSLNILLDFAENLPQ